MRRVIRIEIVKKDEKGEIIRQIYSGEEAELIMDVLSPEGGLIVRRGGFEGHRFLFEDLKYKIIK